MSAANRKRGQRAEVQVVNYLRAAGWPDARRYLSGDGRQPGDIDFHPLICLEVKDRAQSSWPSWCRQAAAEAPKGTIPVVVRRTRGVTDVGQWECRVRADDILTVNDLHPTDWWYVVDGREWWAGSFGSLVAAVHALDHPAPVPDEGTR